MPGSNSADLVLLRHGIAEPSQAGQDHPDRPLTAFDQRLGLVGHEPDLGDLACGLLGCAPGSLVLKKAGVIQLRRSTGQWQLKALLRPALLIDDLGCC